MNCCTRIEIAAALIALAAPFPANAAAGTTCTDSRPATLHFTEAPADRVVQLNSGQHSDKEYFFGIEITGCRLASGNHKARLIGLAKGTGVFAHLEVSRNGEHAELVIDPSKNSLGPGAYPVTAVSDDPAIDLWHPAAINVRDSAPLPWFSAFLAATVIGLFILVLRAAANGDERWTNLRRYANVKTLAPGVTGIIAALTLVGTQALANDNWYGRWPQLFTLFLAMLAAVISVSTATTAASGTGANDPSRGELRILANPERRQNREVNRKRPRGPGPAWPPRGR